MNGDGSGRPDDFVGTGDELPCALESGMVPGRIVEIRQLASSTDYEPTHPWYLPAARFKTDVYYVEYESLVDCGAVIAATLYVPASTSPPPDGWPILHASHQFGGPGKDFYRWPFAGDWTNIRTRHHGLSFSRHGFAVLVPWLPGAGPSGPFATYDLLNTRRHMPFISATYLAFKHLEEQFGERYGFTFDLTRAAYEPQCGSTATGIAFLARWRTIPGAEGLKTVMLGAGPASIAYNIVVRYPELVLVTDAQLLAAAMGLQMGPVYMYATGEQRPFKDDPSKTVMDSLELFFTPQAAAWLQEEVYVPELATSLPRLRAAELEPVFESDIKDSMRYEIARYAKETRGLEQSIEVIANNLTRDDMAEWVWSDRMRRLIAKSGEPGPDDNAIALQRILDDEFYREHFANQDPFFTENWSDGPPGDPGVTLWNVYQLRTSDPFFLERDLVGYYGQTLPIVETLRRWGWHVVDFFEERYGRGADLSDPGTYGAVDLSGGLFNGPGHVWAVRGAMSDLYGGEENVPPEIRGDTPGGR